MKNIGVLGYLLLALSLLVSFSLLVVPTINNTAFANDAVSTSIFWFAFSFIYIWYRQKRSKKTPKQKVVIDTLTDNPLIKENSNNISSESSELLKEATKKKRTGDIDGAIECLRQAYKAISKSSTVYTVKTFLRLPLYLQAANKNDEAWAEFNKLIVEGYPNQSKNTAIMPMDLNSIYDKMRLFLQREKKHDKAVKFGIYSEICWVQGLYYQERKKELNSYLPTLGSGESTDHLKFLDITKRTACNSEINKVVQHHLSDFPSVKFGQLGRDIDSIVCKK